MATDLQLTNISEKDLEQCLKCSICTVYCPVSSVTPLYPGPKHAGPDGERYRIKDRRFFDEDALKMCLNCKRCEVACPHGVQIGDIIQTARIKYSRHTVGLRDFMLANTDLLGSVATKAAPIVNYMTKAAPVKSILHNVMGIEKNRTFPDYTSRTFESWYKKEAAAEQDKFEKQVSYFHGCYVNYNFPQLGKDLVKVMNAIGYGVKLLDKERCCGIALITNNMPNLARKQGKMNLKSMRHSVEQGRPIIATSSTCTFTMRNEYEHILHLDNEIAKNNLSLATRFICRLVEEGKVRMAFRKDFHMKVAYHTPCHMERLGWAVYSTNLIKRIPGVDFQMLESQCCGIGGTYGFKKENYSISQKIGENLFHQIREAQVDYVVTDCETCKWQLEMSVPIPVINPISLLAQALDVEETRKLNQL